jgi:hypothetical protein
MKRMNHSRPRLPIEDYSIELRKAIDWLGERYVLAVPGKPSTRGTARAERSKWIGRRASADVSARYG